MKVNIVGIKTKISERQKNYIIKKVDNLEKYLPLAQRNFARAEVRIKENWHKKLKQLNCEICLILPGRTLRIRDSDSNSALAAFEAAKDRLKVELSKHKEKNATPKLRQKLVARYRRRGLAV